MMMKIQAMLPSVWEQVSNIYLEGINTGNATFQKEVPSWEDWNKTHLNECRIVAILEDQIVGWAALSPISRRCVYAGVAEVSVYVSQKYNRRGIGSALMKSLIEQSEEHDIWTLQSGVFPENIPSIHLHKKYGFREVGIRERIGRLDGAWRDVVLLERRSERVGNEE
jgi:L-amino acid N-acyltransferase YncA